MFLKGMKGSALVIVTLVLVLFSACSGFEKTVKSTDHFFKLKEAKRYYAKEDYYRAQVLYDQIAPVFRGTDKADSIYFYQAMTYFKQSDYMMAGHYFQTLSNTYGASTFVEQADYMSAYCYYRISPRPELDQQHTMMAIQSFQKFLMKHPRSDQKEEALDYIEELKDKLVEKSFISARLYFDLEDYKASLVALNNSLEEYPESQHREDMMFMVFKSSFKYAENSISSKRKERFQTALDDYYSFKAEFPESKYMKEASKYYEVLAKFLENIKEELN